MDTIGKHLVHQPGAQVVWLNPLKPGTKFRNVQKSADGHTWVRLGRLLVTDCTCINAVTGKRYE